MVRTVDQSRRRKKQQQIIDASFQCFAEKGFHRTSMQDICQKVGMSPGSLYRYFASKDDIIIAIVEQDRREIDEFIDYLKDQDNLIDSLCEIVSHVIKRSRDPVYAQITVEVYAELFRNEQAMNLAVTGYEKVNQFLVQLIRQAIVRGEIAPSWDPQGLAEVLIMLIDALETRPPFGKKASDEVIYQTVTQLINLVRLKT